METYKNKSDEYTLGIYRWVSIRFPNIWLFFDYNPVHESLLGIWTQFHFETFCGGNYHRTFIPMYLLCIVLVWFKRNWWVSTWFPNMWLFFDYNPVHESLLGIWTQFHFETFCGGNYHRTFIPMYLLCIVLVWFKRNKVHFETWWINSKIILITNDCKDSGFKVDKLARFSFFMVWITVEFFFCENEKCEFFLSFYNFYKLFFFRWYTIEIIFIKNVENDWQTHIFHFRKKITMVFHTIKKTRIWPISRF